MLRLRTFMTSAARRWEGVVLTSSLLDSESALLGLGEPAKQIEIEIYRIESTAWAGINTVTLLQLLVIVLLSRWRAYITVTLSQISSKRRPHFASYQTSERNIQFSNILWPVKLYDLFPFLSFSQSCFMYFLFVSAVKSKKPKSFSTKVGVRLFV